MKGKKIINIKKKINKRILKNKKNKYKKKILKHVENRIE